MTPVAVHVGDVVSTPAPQTWTCSSEFDSEVDSKAVSEADSDADSFAESESVIQDVKAKTIAKANIIAKRLNVFFMIIFSPLSYYLQ